MVEVVERKLARAWIIRLGALAFLNGIIVGITIERFLLA